MPKFNMDLYNKKKVPYEKDFLNNDNLRKEILVKIEPELKNVGVEYSMTEKLLLVTDGNEKLELFEKGWNIRNRINSQMAILNEFQKQYKLDVIGPFSRVAYSLMKLPKDGATKEEIEAVHKENLDTFLKYSDPRNTEKLVKEVVDYAVNFDYTKILNLNEKSAMNLYLMDSKISYLFCIDSILGTNATGLNLTNEFGQALKKMKSVIETASDVEKLSYIAGSAVNLFIPEELSAIDTMSLSFSLAPIINQYMDNGTTGFVRDNNSDFGLNSNYNYKYAKEMFHKDAYEKYLGQIIKDYGKDFLLKYNYQGSNLSKDIDDIVKVDKALEAYELIGNPDVSKEQMDKYNTIINSAKEVLNLKNEKDDSKVKEALNNYKENHKFTFVKRTDEEINRTFGRIFESDNLVEMMSNERADFRASKANGNTTLASEVNALANKHVTKKDTPDLLRVYGEVKTRIDNRKWYSYLAFWNISKQNSQLSAIQAKITESGNNVGLFNKAYDELKKIDQLEAIRTAEHLDGPNYLGRETYNQKYSVKSERDIKVNEPVNENIVNKDLVADNNVIRNAEIKDEEIEKIEVNNDINTNITKEDPNLDLEK